MGAFWKFSNSEQTVPSLEGIPHGAWIGMSLFEILCAICLILPALKKEKMLLAPLAAVGIGFEMLIFTAAHLDSGYPHHAQMIYWLAVAAVCAFIAFKRFRESN